MSADSLAARISSAPIPFDTDRAAGVRSELPEALNSGATWDLVAGVAGSSPYLARLIERHGEWLAEAIGETPEAALDRLLADLGSEASDQRALGTELRLAKSRAALLVALADLGGVWDLGQVTGALTRLADAALRAAAGLLLRTEVAQGRLPGLDDGDLASGAGYVVLAMGKHGARELNYSSDIDLICLFDQDRFEPDDFAAAKARYIHVTKQVVKLLGEATQEGYVFRTDLRLRPAPSTTPVCMAMEAAERYYESVGRTWERAAHIKARPAAGDLKAGAEYLDRLTPFVWRRYLDFAAIEDTHAMLRKIRAQKGRFSPGEIPGHDIKLGPGGIREIEFFAQTRQLICGGRDPRLRVPTTLGALTALTETGWVGAETTGLLAEDYAAHRTLEHRLQMVEDAQTHIIPKAPEARARLAALCGWSDRAAFERDIAERLARVHAAAEEFFTPGPGASKARAEIGEAELAEAGFERPGDAERTLERWRDADIPATRSARARALFKGLEPLIIEKLAAAGSPDEAMAQFDRFLGGLPGGVQVFSLFTANPHLLDLIVEICAAAPRLAAHLGRRPQALDALLDQAFFEPLPGAEVLTRELTAWLRENADYENLLDDVRVWAREQAFRAGVQVLRAIGTAEEAGRAFSAIAEAALTVLYPRVVDDFTRRHGPPPGRGMVVIAMGKLGSREMTAGSDLDLITVYDAGGAEASEGPKPLPPVTYFPRLTQALVGALTAPTGEGRLYEVDMRLRPSGRQGPVATSISAFQKYQSEQAWVWEHLALTRARVIAGDASLGAEVEAIVREVLTGRKGDPRVLEEAAGMRGKLIEAHAKEHANPWSLKHAAGGLMEIEFLAQTGVLYHGLDCRAAGRALTELADCGWVTGVECADLTEAFTLMQRLQQMERVALETPVDPQTAGEGLRRAMARGAEAESFADLAERLAALQAASAAVSQRLFDE
ncbi:MAG: bifunctional [glutamine synthetase] adenylyltransferase/[glutamine synthetase]-adenylyl-L-tyrosine phosphorylase [Paracoccaceae bacterium]|nr:bifunctional [glutamine synthetase] adenylyltransferase/[glutamine synthetase]-adenylyl-L-tyrosine phosphorylase [Paracoccaceae bacterium]